MRITREDRAALAAEQLRLGGPQELGPWLVWKGLRDRPGNASAPQWQGALDLGAQVGQGRRRDDVPISDRLILDLCGGTGSWSAPYRAAGYPVELVTLPEKDVRLYVPPAGVWGVLAAPPCERFSLAPLKPVEERDVVQGMETVNACLRVIFQARPVWWALENPIGYLQRWLGTPRDVWDPCDFGDEWTKRTAIWGDYVLPERGPWVKPLWGGGPPCSEGHGDITTRKIPLCHRPECRAKTPPGFARAFMGANP